MYGQESNDTTWRLAKVNLGIDGNLGPRNADTFHNDLHKELRDRRDQKRPAQSGPILVIMTRTRRPGPSVPKSHGKWALQDAKARFSEVVRRAKSEGPQRITVHGREEVVIVSVEEYRRAKGQPTGEALVKLLHDSPLRNLKIERTRTRAAVRDVEL